MPTYKINYSGGKARVVNVNKLPNKTTLQSLDRVDRGQPFVNTVSKFQDTRGLETVYNGQPFYGHTDAIAISSSRISTANHPDVNNWLNTVSLNGGSASSSTIAALNTFCNSIDAAGLRNKFYRLNLFCGNNLNACLVPLYVNSNYILPVLGGFSIDQNNSSDPFLTSDYTETGNSGGLRRTALANRKFLNTGLSLNLLPDIATGHLSIYRGAGTASSKAAIGVTSLDNTEIYRIDKRGDGSHQVLWGKNTTTGLATEPTHEQAGLITGTRTSSSSLKMFYNNTLISSNITNTSPGMINNRPIYVFVHNAYDIIPSSVFEYWEGTVPLRGYSIGSGLSDNEVSTYSNIMQTFQTALNRNV